MTEDLKAYLQLIEGQLQLLAMFEQGQQAQMKDQPAPVDGIVSVRITVVEQAVR